MTQGQFEVEYPAGSNPIKGHLKKEKQTTFSLRGISGTRQLTLISFRQESKCFLVEGPLEVSWIIIESLGMDTKYCCITVVGHIICRLHPLQRGI